MKKSKDQDQAAARIEALYQELVKAFYDAVDRERAKEAATQLTAILGEHSDFTHSIRGEEINSIIADLQDDLPAAIQSREAEIRKMLELHETASRTKTWAYVSKIYDYSDVSDRLDLLANLYDKLGEQDRAIAVLMESKSYCQSHGIPFSGQELLKELEETRNEIDQPAGLRAITTQSLNKAIRAAYQRFGVTIDEILVSDRNSRLFTAEVKQLLPQVVSLGPQDIKKRLLKLRSTQGGLPRLKSAARSQTTKK